LSPGEKGLTSSTSMSKLMLYWHISRSLITPSTRLQKRCDSTLTLKLFSRLLCARRNFLFQPVQHVIQILFSMSYHVIECYFKIELVPLFLFSMKWYFSDDNYLVIVLVLTSLTLSSWMWFTWYMFFDVRTASFSSILTPQTKVKSINSLWFRTVLVVTDERLTHVLNAACSVLM
jgi:hypothetical protein